MAKRWYVETKSFDGTWRSEIMHGDRPSEKTAGGTKREIRNVQEIPATLAHLSIEQLCEHSARAEFRSTRQQPSA